MITNTGMNRVRTLVQNDIFKCQAGTGTTAPTVADTTLEFPDATTLLAPTIATAEQALQITFQIPSTTGSGTIYAEEETQIEGGSTMLNRIVHTELTKGSLDEFNYITIIYIKSI